MRARPAPVRSLAGSQGTALRGDPDRTDAVVLLDALEDVAKGRASLIRSCKELAGTSSGDSEGLACLLRAVTEQRKRVRAVRRLWWALAPGEPPPGELVDATQVCLEEVGAIAQVIDELRRVSLAEIGLSLSRTWTALAAVADEFVGTHQAMAPATRRTPGIAGMAGNDACVPSGLLMPEEST